MQRESFKSRLGFLLVSAGCAIGIGNVWRFPYVAGNNGGGIFDLLYMFLTNRQKSFSRDDILNNIWGENYFGTDRVVDDLIRRLRKKMPLLDINTIYGYGYRLL